MSLMEQERLLEKRRSDFQDRFSQLYEQTSFWGNLCFRKADGGIFSLCSFPDDLALSGEEYAYPPELFEFAQEEPLCIKE